MKQSPNQLITAASLLGALMIGFALLLQGWAWGEWFPNKQGWAQEVALGALLGFGAALGIGWASERVEALKNLRDLVLKTLNIEQLRFWQALAFGFLAGIPEEIFFRGSIQSLTHPVIAALIFGLLHAITPFYALYASLAGLLLGFLALWRGDLWAATAAHVVYDAALFCLILLRR